MIFEVCFKDTQFSEERDNPLKFIDHHIHATAISVGFVAYYYLVLKKK